MAAPAATEFAAGKAVVNASGSFVPALVVVALAGAMLSPLWLLLVLPLVLGVPHVLGDVRVLWLQRPFAISARQVAVVAAPLAGMTLLRALSLAGARTPAALEVACGVLAVTVAAALGTNSLAGRRRLVVPAMVVAAVTIAFPRATTLLLAHAHNLVAFAMFAGIARRHRGVVATIVCYAVAWGVVLAVPGNGTAGDAVGAFGWSTMTDDLAPGLDGAWADRLVRSFAFAQAVHYGLWTWALPRARGTTLRREIGDRGLVGCLLLCAFFPAIALLDPVATRAGYLSLVVCHGWFELAALAFVFARRRGGVS